MELHQCGCWLCGTAGAVICIVALHSVWVCTVSSNVRKVQYTVCSCLLPCWASTMASSITTATNTAWMQLLAHAQSATIPSKIQANNISSVCHNHTHMQSAHSVLAHTLSAIAPAQLKVQPCNSQVLCQVTLNLPRCGGGAIPAEGTGKGAATTA